MLSVLQLIELNHYIYISFASIIIVCVLCVYY